MNKNNLKYILIILISAAMLCSLYIFKNSYLKKIAVLNEQIAELNQKNFSQSQKILTQSIETQTLLVSFLKKYMTYDNNGPLSLIRMGQEGDGGYLVPEIALKSSDALLGYGISNDISFEEEFSNKYDKESYGFDCSIKQIEIKNPLVHFIPECIETEEFSDNPKFSSKISSFSQQIKNLDLVGKKVFIKMDIEGAEYHAFNEILHNANNITGIVMEIHLNTWTNNFEKAISLLSAINQNFYLVNIHGNNCSDETFPAKNVKGEVSRLLQLSYVNKNLVKAAFIDKDQSHPAKMDIPNCKEKAEHEFTILTSDTKALSKK